MKFLYGAKGKHATLLRSSAIDREKRKKKGKRRNCIHKAGLRGKPFGQANDVIKIWSILIKIVLPVVHRRAFPVTVRHRICFHPNLIRTLDTLFPSLIKPVSLSLSLSLSLSVSILFRPGYTYFQPERELCLRRSHKMNTREFPRSFRNRDETK